MRLLILILLIANLLTFAWMQWGQPVPAPIPREQYPERIQIVHAAPPVIATPKPSTSPSLPTQTAAPVAVPIPATQIEIATAPVTTANNICLSWGPIPAHRVDDASLRLSHFKLGERLSTLTTDSQGGPYWVYLPPLKSKAEADDKLSALTNAGIKDIAIVRDGKWQNAISMGLYGKEAAANEHLAKLKQQGINAQIEARGKATRNFSFQHLNIEEVQAIKKMQATFGGPAIKKTACE
ncbi:MAG: SPOR domain-containing protein [Sulfuriferula sp.]|nr:SPOR domain-containing protein [Sulfuriferula sp.]